MGNLGFLFPNFFMLLISLINFRASIVIIIIIIFERYLKKLTQVTSDWPLTSQISLSNFLVKQIWL